MLFLESRIGLTLPNTYSLSPFYYLWRLPLFLDLVRLVGGSSCSDNLESPWTWEWPFWECSWLPTLFKIFSGVLCFAVWESVAVIQLIFTTTTYPTTTTYYYLLYYYYFKPSQKLEGIHFVPSKYLQTYSPKCLSFCQNFFIRKFHILQRRAHFTNLQ